MDEKNINELNWYPSENNGAQPENQSEQPVFAVSAEAKPEETRPDMNSFAYNDNPNQTQNGTYYNYQPGMNGAGGVYQEPLAPLDNSAAQAKAKRSMIMGIIAAASVTSCFCFPVGIILGIIALVNASKAKKLSVTGNMPGMAIPGLICGICGLAMSALWLVYFGIFALAFIIAGAQGSLPSEEVYLGLSQLFR